MNHLTPQRPETPNKPNFTRLTLARLAMPMAASLCIGAALFLRFGSGNPLRDSISNLLGDQWRAALEHLLTGVGVPFLAGIGFSAAVMCMCMGSRALGLRLGWTWAPVLKSPSEVMPPSAVLSAVIFLALAYFGYSVFWEVGQANVGVNGKPPRGYIQWEQLSADVIGAIAAVVLVWFGCRRNLWGVAPARMAFD